MTQNTLDITDLAARHTSGSKLMGLDLGTKTIGIAVSDIRLEIATARETLKRKKFTQDAQMLLELAK